MSVGPQPAPPKVGARTDGLRKEKGEPRGGKNMGFSPSCFQGRGARPERSRFALPERFFGMSVFKDINIFRENRPSDERSLLDFIFSVCALGQIRCMGDGTTINKARVFDGICVVVASFCRPSAESGPSRRSKLNRANKNRPLRRLGRAFVRRPAAGPTF